MNITFRNIVYVLLLLLAVPAHAQTQFTGWLASFNTFTIKKPWSLHLDVQLRSTDQWQQTQIFLARTGVNYHFRKGQVMTAGYAFIDSRRTIQGVSALLPEHRVWQQLLLQQKMKIGKKALVVAHRFRTEQRFLPVVVKAGDELVKNGTDFAQRFRYFTRCVIPFAQTKVFKKGAFASLQDELFFNIGDNDAVNNKVFDQNRFYTSLGYRVSAAFDIEIGYMNQYVSGRGSAYTNNHILQLAAYIRK